MKDSKLIPAFALWEGRTKTGEVYYSGRWGELKVLVFPERSKKSEKAPDARVYFAPIERKDESSPVKKSPVSPMQGREPGDDEDFDTLPF